MNLLTKIFSAPRVGYRWVCALERAAEGDYQAALELVGKVKHVFEGKNPEFHLLRGFLLFATNDDPRAIEEFGEAKRLIQARDDYNEYEKRYLLCYAGIWESVARGNAKPSVDPNKVRLEQVRSALKRNFPLREHPNWPDVDAPPDRYK